MALTAQAGRAGRFGRAGHSRAQPGTASHRRRTRGDKREETGPSCLEWPALSNDPRRVSSVEWRFTLRAEASRRLWPCRCRCRSFARCASLRGPQGLSFATGDASPDLGQLNLLCSFGPRGSSKSERRCRPTRRPWAAEQRESDERAHAAPHDERVQCAPSPPYQIPIPPRGNTTTTRGYY